AAPPTRGERERRDDRDRGGGERDPRGKSRAGERGGVQERECGPDRDQPAERRQRGVPPPPAQVATPAHRPEDQAEQGRDRREERPPRAPPPGAERARALPEPAPRERRRGHRDREGRPGRGVPEGPRAGDLG